MPSPRNQMFFFVLSHGKLSTAEILSVLEKAGITHKLVASNDSVAVFSVDNYSENAVSTLGGFHKMGKILTSCNVGDLEPERIASALNDKEFYVPLQDKVRWTVSMYDEEEKAGAQNLWNVRDYLSEEMKREGVKKVRFVLPKVVQRGVIEVSSEEISQKEITDFVIIVLGSVCHMGRTISVIDHEGFRKIDLSRPFQNPKISIPPKLARLLVNLTSIGRGKILLDPFCGIATVLQEALMVGADVRGLDVDRRMVEAARKNLEWASQEYSLDINLEGKLVRDEAKFLSKYFPRESVDGVATEPILLPSLRSPPSEDAARQMIRRPSRIYGEALEEIFTVLKKGGRLSIVAPFVRTSSGTLVSFELEEEARTVGFVTYNPGDGEKWEWPLFPTTSGREIVLRGIFVFGKP